MIEDDPEDRLVFFLDRSIDIDITAVRLASAGADIRRHRSEYPRRDSIPDYIWLADVGAKRWLVLTCDDGIQANTIEIDAIVKAEVGAFIYRGGSQRSIDIAETLASVYPKMEQFAANTPRPFIYQIYKNGDIKRSSKV